MTLFLYFIVLCAACGAGVMFLHDAPGKHFFRHMPKMTIFLCAILVILFCMQLLLPALLSSFERDYSLIAAGEWWRLFTSLFFQDGKLAGCVFNVASLLIAGSVSEQLWKARYSIAIFLFCGWLTQLPALLWQPVGAGNSVGTFGLAACAAVFCACSGRRIPLYALAAATIIAGIALAAFHDIHGIAVLLGGMCGVGLFFMEIPGLRTTAATE